jgi:hypothetical protein
MGKADPEGSAFFSRWSLVFMLTADLHLLIFP